MKPQAAMVCCLAFFLATECFHYRPKLHIKDEDKLQNSEGKPKTGRIQEKCHGPCTSPSNCSQPCAKSFHGEIGFTCTQKQWQKSTETCTSLSMEKLFEDSSGVSRLSVAAPSIALVPLSKPGPKPENVTQGILKNCPLDYACIIDTVKASAATAGNIAFIVELLKNISTDLSNHVTREKMKSYGEVANHILDTAALSNWTFIPDKNASADFLQSVNWFAGQLCVHDESEDVVDELFIQTKGFRVNHNTTEKSFNFSMGAKNTAESISGLIEIPRQQLQKLPPRGASPAVSLAFPTLGAILNEAHLPNASLSRPINGLVLSVILPESLKEILLTFEKINKSRNARAQCVGWHSKKRRWDETACETTSDVTNRAKCRCNYTKVVMSFSILMSPRSAMDRVLDYITCIGLSVSILSLVLCLIVEAMVWSRVVVTEISYMRHVCIVNIAVSLLIADVWFIIGSNFNKKAQDYSWCVAVTFFCHFFYLSLFFWMLFKALLITYGILVIFRRMMKSRMMAIGFVLGYGCPLVIAVTTVAVTEPEKGYVRPDACWLDWDNSKALFAFAVPALVIVAVNLLVVLVVAINTQRPSIGSSKSQDMAIIMRISKNVAILTPLLGLTWGFGIITLIEGTSLVFHIIFALLNAFQGFFILLFGTIMDHKIRDALRMRMSSLKGKSRAAENASLSPTNGSKLMNR